MSGYRHPPPSQALVRSWLRDGGTATVDLDTSYELCRRLNAAHGRTYYFATRFLPPDRRRHVHALYGFARYADDLVDHLDLPWDGDRRARALHSWADEMSRCIAGGQTDDPVLKAAVHTVATLGIRHDDVRAFLRSMAMDAHVTRYPTWAALSEYVHGSAAVIGSMLLPILGARHPRARERAMDLGVAFQLTNFLRDVGEDWDRGRIYLPLEDLDRFGVTEADFRARRVGPALARLLAFEVSRTRALYRRAEEGWWMLPPTSRPCVRIAHRLYAQILDRIEAADYQVFAVRATVPAGRKLAVAAGELVLPRTISRMAPPGARCDHGRVTGRA